MFDLALQHCGSADVAIDIALLNNLNIYADNTDEEEGILHLLNNDLPPQVERSIPAVINPRVVKAYTAAAIQPATAIAESTMHDQDMGGDMVNDGNVFNILG